MKVPQAIYLSMLMHAVLDRPRECVGILAGQPGEQTVLRLFRCTNVASDACSRFMVSAEDQQRVEREMIEAGLVPLAIYHSHPSSDVKPSLFDWATAFNPVVVIIISLASLPDITVCAYELHGRDYGHERDVTLEVG